MTGKQDRIDQRTFFQVRLLDNGHQKLIYRYPRNDRLSAGIMDAVYRAEVEAGHVAQQPANVTLGWLDGTRWRPADNPYAVALSGLPKIRARIDALIKGVSPPVRVTGSGSSDRQVVRRRRRP